MSWLSLDYVGGFILVTGCTALSIVGLFLARKFISLEQLKACHEVGGYLLSVAGTLYAVLLGLVVVDAMTKFQTARNIVEQEANCVADVYVLAARLPEGKRECVRNFCKQYVNTVVNKEWPILETGGISQEARCNVITIMDEVMDFEPKNENEKAIYPLMIQEACQLWDNRRARTNMSSYGIPKMEWFVLIVGGVVTVIFTYFFGLENIKAQIAMTGMVGLLISLNLFLVALFGYPFSGDLKIEPDAFKVDLAIFDKLEEIQNGKKPSVTSQ